MRRWQAKSNERCRFAMFAQKNRWPHIA